MPKGIALYVRKISKKSHGTPHEFAKKYAAAGLRWVALAGPWQDPDSSGVVRTRMINTPEVINAYGKALEKAGVEVWVWGYPWIGHEHAFVSRITSTDFRRILLDPELGANPTRASSGAGKKEAEKAARTLVRLLKLSGNVFECGLSTYGSGWKLKWFPLVAYTRALAEFFPGASFIGGQTYTDDNAIDPSISDMRKAVKAAKADGAVEIVPNFGMYQRVNGKVRAKTPEELLAHLTDFVDDPLPIEALIGWAENFATPQLWETLKKFSRWANKGVLQL